MLTQWSAINLIKEKCIESQLVDAIYLKGSFARGTADEYSDIDLYCLVSEENLNAFLPMRLDILQSFKPILYYSEVNFVGPQIVCVFDDGRHFDLYTQTPSNMSVTDAIKILYDPNKHLEKYTQKSFALSLEDLSECFNECTFVMLEFLSAYKRHDTLWAHRLASHLSGDMSILLRHLCDPENAQLGLKNLHRKLDTALQLKYEKATLAPLPENAKLLADILKDISAHFEPNFPFFNFIYKEIQKLT